jgi:nucleoside-diphosphate-sugar epimerase
MKVVLTGATGFVGGAVARRLAAEGAELHALTLPGSDRARLAGVPVAFHSGDITTGEGLDGLFDGATWVIHAAGMLGRAGVSDNTYRRVNAEGTRHVLAAADAARRAGRTAADLRVLHVSSAGVLGPVTGKAGSRGQGPGAREERSTPGTWNLEPGTFPPPATPDETWPHAPSNAYERSKALAEQYAAEFAASGLPLVIARPEFIYGPGDVHVLGLFRAIQRGVFFYIGDGTNTCHPTYVDDMVDGLLACLRRGALGGVYHIAGPRPLPFRELAETIAAALGVPPPRWRVPVPLAWLGAAGLEAAGKLAGRDVPLSRTGVAFFSENRRSTYARAERELGFTPQVELQEGVARTVAWYRAEGLI